MQKPNIMQRGQSMPNVSCNVPKFSPVIIVYKYVVVGVNGSYKYGEILHSL